MTTRKTKAKVEEVIENVEAVEEKEIAEAPKKAKAAPKKADEPFFVTEGQTEVSSRRKLINFLPRTKRVVVENLGGGDLYVGTTNINFTKENLVRIGESKEITDVDYFYVGALSRPTFRISHFE